MEPKTLAVAVAIAAPFAAGSAATAELNRANITLTSNRVHGAGGLLDLYGYVAAQANFDGPPTPYAPGRFIDNSMTSWMFPRGPDNPGGSSFRLGYDGSFALVDPFSGAEANAWMLAFGTGTWSADLGAGPIEFTLPSAAYAAPSERAYAELTTASFQLWRDIVSQGLTGTFTLEMTRTVEEMGASSVEFIGAAQGIAATNSGRFLSLQVSAQTDWSMPLMISVNRTASVAFQDSGNQFLYWERSNTMLVPDAVPAPGAIALLGLAGAVGLRRRR